MDVPNVGVECVQGVPNVVEFSLHQVWLALVGRV